MATKKATTIVTRKHVTLDELEQFIREFQKADSIEDVADEMGWKTEKVRTQATRLRKRGVALKAFPRQSSLSEADFAGLAALADGK